MGFAQLSRAISGWSLKTVMPGEIRGWMLLGLFLIFPLSTARPQPAPESSAIQADLWGKELAIYAGRGRGDLEPYIGNASANFAAWPPGAAKPVDLASLKASAPQAAKSREKLDLTFERLVVSGGTAVIYYRTHMTVRPDGTPTDEHYEVTHTWILEQGHWRILGGMARPAAIKPG